MEGPLDQYDPGRMRVSDSDRHRVAEILREAAAEGRIDIEELDERLETTYAAKTYADLVPITLDLPVVGGAQSPVQLPFQAPVPSGDPSGLPAARHDHSLAIMGGVTRKGLWELGPTHSALAMMAGVTLDLREARLTARETVIYANAFWAGIDVIVNEHTHVVVDGVGIMGSFEQARDKVAPVLGPDSPVVRVKGVALMAGVTVQRRPTSSASRKRLGRGH